MVWIDFKGSRITVTPEDMKDEKSFRVRLLRNRVYWLTLPKARKGPDPFELLMKNIVEKSRRIYRSFVHRYSWRGEILCAQSIFFESHIEQDKFDKLKDGYVVLDY